MSGAGIDPVKQDVRAGEAKEEKMKKVMNKVKMTGYGYSPSLFLRPAVLF